VHVCNLIGGNIRSLRFLATNRSSYFLTSSSSIFSAYFASEIVSGTLRLGFGGCILNDAYDADFIESI
jgi:hypothetical protein